jgi:translation initiation factor 1
MAKKKKKISIDGDGPSLPDDRFAALAGLFTDDSKKELSKFSTKDKEENDKKDTSSPKSKVVTSIRKSKEVKDSQIQNLWKADKTRKGNFDIRLEKRGGGKTVTVLNRISGDLKLLLKELKKRCACGGAIRENTIEIQGDHQDKIDLFLKEYSS